MKISIIAICCLLAIGAKAQEKSMKAYMVADAHLDTQWNWDVQTTIRRYVWNTLNQNLFLLKQYPDYIFNFEGGVKYAWMKEYYPLQYEELKKYIAEGRWHITGSGWDANETIICSPESWMRNILLGQTFYRKEFGTEGTDVFLPDCFGFPYILPTLAHHCGLIGFSSQKLIWRTHPFYEGNKRVPFSFGLWQGIDGSRIMMAHGFNYSQRYNEEDLSNHEPLIKEIGESPLNIAYHYYGTGDIGGSPTIPSVLAVMKGMKGKGPVEVISATSDQLYKDFLPYEKHPELPVFDGELTMDVHGNGCYTSQAAMKLYNRQNEHLGDAAERASVMAAWAGTTAYPTQRLTDNWRRVIWHQFHDDVTGTSIPRAYEFSWNDELLALKTFSDVLTHSISGISSQMDTRVSGTPIVVYNNEAFPVKAVAKVDLEKLPISTDKKNWQVTDANGRVVPSQTINQDGKPMLLFDADVPSAGLAVYGIKPGGKASTASFPSLGEVGGGTTTLENSAYKVSVDKFGDVVSIFDKQANKELVATGKSIRFVVFDDCTSTSWPAWEILKATIDKEPLPVHDGVSLSVEKGPLRQTFVINKNYGNSRITQRIHLNEGSLARRIDFENEVDWHSENSLLKAEFPLGVSNEEASYDLGLGSIKRGNNRDTAYEVYAHEWTDLTDRSGQYGVTILNDSRYGWDKPNDNTLRLSLLYAPKPGRHYTYQAQQDMGLHRFTYSIIGHEGALDNISAVQQSTVLNSPLRTFIAPKHAGTLGKQFSFVTSDNDNVVVRALKHAEASNEYVIRVYEVGGKTNQTAHLTFASNIDKVVEADGTERAIGSASYSGNSLDVNIAPYSVKTYKLQFAPITHQPSTINHQPSTINPQPLSLDYNRRCFSFNEFRSSADFEGGYSFAAELMPQQTVRIDGHPTQVNAITVNDIPFHFGKMDGMNGLSCEGQTIDITSHLSPLTSHPSPLNHHLYLLAAADDNDRQADFWVGSSKQNAYIPYYTGFIGQWGHDGHTQGYLKDATVAYVGTHRHSTNDDEPYEYTYMFLVRLDIPKGAKTLTLPNDPHIVIFAATLADDEAGVVPAHQLFETSHPSTINHPLGFAAYTKGDSRLKEPSEVENLLLKANIIAKSGEVNEWEQATNLIDGRTDTKWCDNGPAPHHVVFDLHQPTTISHWHMVNAAVESSAYITRTCLLQGRLSENDEWQTIDMIDGNRYNIVDRTFEPVTVRFLRLFVVGPTQENGGATRIYELNIY